MVQRERCNELLNTKHIQKKLRLSKKLERNQKLTRTTEKEVGVSNWILKMNNDYHFQKLSSHHQITT